MTCTCTGGYEVSESTITEHGGRMVLTWQTVADPECDEHDDHQHQENPHGNHSHHQR